MPIGGARSVQRVSVDGPAGALEAILVDTCSEDSPFAVICHPHPLFGGTMENKVVTTLARACAAAAIPTLRFNFRGVGKSAGTYAEGIGEIADAAAVAAWGEQRWPARKLLLAGFSFGGYVALKLSQQLKPTLLITVAPAIEHFDVSSPAALPAHWLLIQGEADEVVNPNAVIRWAQGRIPAPTLVLLPGVGHFFHGQLQRLRAIVTDFVAQAEVVRSDSISTATR